MPDGRDCFSPLGLRMGGGMAKRSKANLRAAVAGRPTPRLPLQILELWEHDLTNPLRSIRRDSSARFISTYRTSLASLGPALPSNSFRRGQSSLRCARHRPNLGIPVGISPLPASHSA